MDTKQNPSNFSRIRDKCDICNILDTEYVVIDFSFNRHYKICIDYFYVCEDCFNRKI